MPVVFDCPLCASSLSLTDKWAGKRGRCPRCKQPIDVPDPLAVWKARSSGPTTTPLQSQSHMLASRLREFFGTRAGQFAGALMGVVVVWPLVSLASWITGLPGEAYLNREARAAWDRERQGFALTSEQRQILDVLDGSIANGTAHAGWIELQRERVAWRESKLAEFYASFTPESRAREDAAKRAEAERIRAKDASYVRTGN